MGVISWALPSPRTIIESPTFTRQLESLGDIERLDDALTGVYWALSTNPGVYEVVKGFKDVRLLKTDALGRLPALRIWFRISPDDSSVHLDYLEALPNGD